MLEMLTTLVIVGFVVFLFVLVPLGFIALTVLAAVNITRRARQNAAASQAFAREARTILRAML